MAEKNEENALSQEELAVKFTYWQNRTIFVILIGYAMYYFVRKNMSIAIPFITDDPTLGIDKSEIGMVLTFHGIIYGLSKFVNGFIGDRVKARKFMVVGLLLSAGTNFVFGFTSSLMMLATLWSLNAWFQGMGVSPCNKLLSHWVPPEQMATKMSIWNTAHSVGAAAALVFCGWVVSNGAFGLGLSWRFCFYLPAIISVFGAMFIWFGIRDTPESVGLPPVKVDGQSTGDDEEEEKMTNKEFWAFVTKYVFKNPVIWVVSIANFFIYSVRFFFLDWGPTILKEWKHIEVGHASVIISAFEIAAIAGMITSGWVTDKVFKGRATRLSAIMMLCTLACMTIFWQIHFESEWINFIFLAVIMALIGFFLYGPQTLVGVIAINHATKKAAASAVGFTGLFAYSSTIFTGYGIGKIVENYGWNAAIIIMLVAALVGAGVFFTAWNAKVHGYSKSEK